VLEDGSAHFPVSVQATQLPELRLYPLPLFKGTRKIFI
jgi:hypothetical protein